MLDVVPPSGGSPRTSPARRFSRKPARNSVVEIDWRLPARLRRPVREELERQRRRRRQREAVVRFERRVSESRAPRAASRAVGAPTNVGAEHHTGDVYRAARPRLAASAPPYAGTFLRPRTNAQRSRVAPSAPRPARAAETVLEGERDVPYQWSATTKKPTRTAQTAVVSERRSRFALPLHFSIWPFRRRAARDPVAVKKKILKSDFLTL